MGSEWPTAATLLDDGADRRSTSELVWSLRSHFHSSKFARVAAILASREEKMKREMKDKDETIKRLEGERLEKIMLEDELRDSKEKRLELEKLVSKLEHENRATEKNFMGMRERVERLERSFHSKLDSGVRISQKRETLEEGTSAAGGKKADQADKVEIIMDIKKENGGAAGMGIRTAGYGNQKADHGDCKGDRREARSRGTATPTSTTNVIEIPDSDDEPTTPKATPGERSGQLHVETGHSGEDGTFVLKRKWSESDIGVSNNSFRDEKVARHEDSRHGGETTPAQQKWGSLPCSRETKSAGGPSSDRKSLLDLPTELISSSSDDMSSDDDLDLTTEFRPL